MHHQQFLMPLSLINSKQILELLRDHATSGVKRTFLKKTIFNETLDARDDPML